MAKNVGHLLTCLLAISVFLWRNVYSSLLPIFKLGCLLLSCRKSLYIRDTRSLTDTQIFSHSLVILSLSSVYFLISSLMRCLHQRWSSANKMQSQEMWGDGLVWTGLATQRGAPPRSERTQSLPRKQSSTEGRYRGQRRAGTGVRGGQRPQWGRPVGSRPPATPGMD